MREVSRITWHPASIPQNAIPFTRDGHPYVLEFDEYNAATLGHRQHGRRRRGAHHRHRRRGAPARDRQPAPRGQPARGAPRGGGRPRRDEPRAGLRRALLQPPDAGRPEARRLLVHRLRPARLRHLRADQAEGDRLLRRADQGPRGEHRRRRATSRCPSPRSCPSAARSGSRDGTCGFYALRLPAGVWPGARARKRPTSAAETCASPRSFTVRVRVPREAPCPQHHRDARRAKVRGQRSGRFVRVPWTCAAARAPRRFA